MFKHLLKICIWDITVWPILSFPGSCKNLHQNLKFFLMFKNLLKKTISGTIWFDPYYLFKDLMYINVFLMLIHFLVLKTYWKIVSHNSLTIIFLFKDSINFSLKVHAFFSVSKIFKEFESWTIWFDLYHPLRKHWSILSKALIGNSDQDKIWFESYCPFKDSTQVSIKSSFLLLEIFLKNFNQGQYGLIHLISPWSTFINIIYSLIYVEFCNDSSKF